jgi:hypothetical protein
MWVFYHKIPVVAANFPSDFMMFIIVGLITGVVILTPSFLERKRNETR